MTPRILQWLNRYIPHVLHWLSRCILAGIFIYTGYVKSDLAHFDSFPTRTLKFSVAIAKYKVTPEKLDWPIATYLPIFEIALGLWILSGWKIKRSAMTGAALLLFFIVLLTITYARGIEADCGCGFGEDEPISPQAIARDSLMLIPALYLLISRPSVGRRLNEENSGPGIQDPETDKQQT
jgi:uncharacterized membrane protein YphA (DoxX/SURF4 family)